MESEREHWETVYATKDATAVSWYEEVPETSIGLIEATGLPHDAAIVDVGGGASSLAASLAERGYSDISVVDISGAALDRARSDLRTETSIDWIEADLRDADLGREFDVWHDRAVLHFMIGAGDRAAYVSTLRRSLRVGGHAIIATFGPEGPTSCSGRPVNRYGVGELSEELEGLHLVSSTLQTHRTPTGTTQQFLYAHFLRDS